MLTAKKIVVYFDSMPTPNASADREPPRAATGLVQLRQRPAAKMQSATTTALSGVAMAEPTAMTSVRLKYSAAVAPTRSSLNRIAPDRHTAQLAGRASRTPNTRTPNSLLPNSVVPRPDQNGIDRRMIVITAGNIFRP